MFRREALRGLAAVGVAATLAGCGSSEPDDAGSQKPPEAPDGSGPAGTSGESFVVTSIDYREGDSGDLVVVATVANRDGQPRSGTLRATVRIDGEETVETAEVTVPVDDSETVEVPFEASFEEFERDGSIDLDLESGT